MTDIIQITLFILLFVFFFVGLNVGRYQVENNLDYLGREIKEKGVRE